MRTSLYDYCREHDLDELLRQWHPSKNEPLTPETVTYGSKRRVWWRCEYGHEWQCSVHSRIGAGTRCPYCTGRLPIPGKTDFATLYPNLAREWHPTKNSPLTTDKVLPNSHRLVWWRCAKGHSWQASVASRVSGCGCPVCANRVILAGYNDLATTHPELAKQWHPDKNMDLTPQNVSAGYDKKVWWRCEHGHEWQAAVKTRVRESSGCPVCANYVAQAGYNDLKTLFPGIAAQWHPSKNGSLTPEQVVAGSNRQVWWQCARGHEWRAAVADRTRGTNGCPYCSNQKVLAGYNDLATTHPAVAAQWHPTLNGTLTPEQVTAGSARRVWWLCPEGHVWRTAVYNRAGRNKQTGCPVCAGNYKVQYRQEQYRERLHQPGAR